MEQILLLHEEATSFWNFFLDFQDPNTDWQLSVGKVIASAAIMCGVLVLALPITIIVDNFIKVAQDEQQAEQAKLEQQSREQAIRAMLNTANSEDNV